MSYYNALCIKTKGWLHVILCCMLAWVLTYATYHLIDHIGYFDNVGKYPMKSSSFDTMKEKIQNGTWFLLCIFWIAVITFLNVSWMWAEWVARVERLEEDRKTSKAYATYADFAENRDKEV